MAEIMVTQRLLWTKKMKRESPQGYEVDFYRSKNESHKDVRVVKDGYQARGLTFEDACRNLHKILCKNKSIN